VSFFRDKQSFVFSLYALNLNFFFNALTILFDFFVNYSPPQIRNTCARN
jgi:hypothetical protein